MRTVQPSIMIGSYGWDQDRLPRDEFDLRVAELNRLMDRNGWSAMLVHGDCEEHRLLAYYTNFVPRLRWAMALLPRNGEPRLLISMSARDMPAMKLSTWIADVRTGWDWPGGFEKWLAGLGDEGKLGALGFDCISGTLMGAVERSLGNRFRLEDASALVPREQPLRPRELSLARGAAALVSRAGAAIASAWREGKGNEAALLAGERAARTGAAQDVRTLASLDGGRTVVPFQGRLEVRHDPFLAYIAVKESGFWSELFISLSGSGALLAKAEAGLDAAVALARPGADVKTLCAAAMREIAPLPLHPVLGGRIGCRLGLSLDEGEGIEPGTLYALHVGAVDPAEGGAIASAMVAITAEGATILCRSRDL